jgi:archaeosine-15-forming tRNA-guanine transglycosylase
MTHLSQPDLTDLARGLKGGQRREREEHLQTCRKCQHDLRVWQALSTQATRSAAQQVPAASVRTVKGAFALHRPRKHSRLQQFATLLFDSLLAPVPEGVRAATITTGGSIRQMLFRSGSLVVDLRLTPQAGTSQMILVGQVLNLSRESVGSPAVRVVLERGRGPLAAAVANEFGEFVLEYVEKDDLRLRLEVLGQRPLFIPLSGAISGVGTAEAGLVRAG